MARVLKDAVIYLAAALVLGIYVLMGRAVILFIGSLF